MAPSWIWSTVVERSLLLDHCSTTKPPPLDLYAEFGFDILILRDFFENWPLCVWGRGGGIYRNGGALPNNRPIVQYLVSEGPDRLSVYVHIYAVYMYIIYICIYCIILVNKGGTSHTTTIMNSWEYQLTNQIFHNLRSQKFLCLPTW